MTEPIVHAAPCKVMLFTQQLEATPSGGRELLCKLNHDLLQEICGDRLVVFELPRQRLQGVKSIINAFRGHIDGLNDCLMAQALERIQAENVAQVFVDGSNFGGFVKCLRQRLPKVEIVTYFHNVEARFFLGSLRVNRTWRALAVLVVNYLAERKSVRYSHKLMCLNLRDSRLLHKVYGRSATNVSPIAVQDTLPKDFADNLTNPSPKFILFVGGNFYANRLGISWFVKHVVPRIHIQTWIVGRGFEEHRAELEVNDQVQLIGAVDNLADYYLKAHLVIAPIFDGSGMKTKVAEALMFGKKIVGTPEAFVGYEDIASSVGWVCSSAEGFAEAIERGMVEVVRSFDPRLRAIYEEKYSRRAARASLAEVLGEAIEPL